MKKIIVSFILATLPFIYSFGVELKIEGIFQGENVYVMNPFAATGVGFCIYEVTVNGETITDEINSSAFEIDLSVFQLKKGEKLSIVIKHKTGCTPKILNPEVLKPKSTFTTTAINVSKDGLLSWTTIEENGKLPYFVEQFKWNKWVRVAAIEGKVTPSENNYAVNVNLHSGMNRFRVKQIDYQKKPRYSLEAKFNNRLMQKVTFSPTKPKNEIVFSAETDYEIYDFYGKLKLKGRGTTLDVSNLPKGEYFLNFDNETTKFSKK